MNAKEAYQKTWIKKQEKEANVDLTHIFKEIEKHIEKGYFSVYYHPVSLIEQEKLRKLGYRVSYDRTNCNPVYKISWEH